MITTLNFPQSSFNGEPKLRERNDVRGGVASNIGVHFFDLPGWIFGDFKGVELEIKKPEKAGGKLYFEKANVNWFLSVDDKDLPVEAVNVGKRTYRKINIEGQELEFSEGFADLHTQSYNDILGGGGFGVNDVKKNRNCKRCSQYT